ncbi:MAG: secretion activator protein, partial [Bacteroidetes bacterium]|nr:secretion activator protein [Bacteroidota bacterium]
MKSNTEQVLAWLGLSEGGYVDHPKDPGGATNHGVTQKTLDAWRDASGFGPISVKLISKTDANEIFIENYFRPIWFDKLPSGLDYAMADFAVNSY